MDRFIDFVTASAGPTISVDFSRTRKIFPNGAVPFVAAMRHFEKKGNTFVTIGSTRALQMAGGLVPTAASTANLDRPKVSNIVWEYSNVTEAVALSHSFVAALTDNVRCQSGVIDSLLWCLYEVLDNVFQHSHATSGFTMLQLHPAEKKCAIAVSDSGIGIHRSFVDGGKKVPRASEAISMAVQERMTSKEGKNQGNGLWGLLRIVEINGGRLKIRSGRGEFSRIEGVTVCRDITPAFLDLEVGHGTTVDWQLDTSKSVTLAEAIRVSHEADRWLEGLEDEEGEYRMYARDFESQLGARTSAANIRLRIENILLDGALRLVIDFTEISIVSSSFGDEVLGKLAFQMGRHEFQKRIRLDGMRSDVRAVIYHAIDGRTKPVARQDE